MNPAATFPFTAVVGQDELKRALTLAAIDPYIGGVLARGEELRQDDAGAGFARVLGDGAPFVELPLGATEDRVLGSIDIAAAPAARRSAATSLLAVPTVAWVRRRPACSPITSSTACSTWPCRARCGRRDGVAATQRTRFVLLGTMNPEEGELRPQLLDRFGLCVAVTATTDVGAVEAVARRLAFEHGELADADDDYRRRLAAVGRPRSRRDAFRPVLALAVGAEGLRADLVLCRAAAALAGWEGGATTTDDVERSHRWCSPIAAGVIRSIRRRSTPTNSTMPSTARQQLDRLPAVATVGRHRIGRSSCRRR